MVAVAVLVGLLPDRRQIFLRRRRQPLGQDLEAFIGQAPARRAVAIEHGDAHEFAHRGQP